MKFEEIRKILKEYREPMTPSTSSYNGGKPGSHGYDSGIRSVSIRQPGNVSRNFNAPPADFDSWVTNTNLQPYFLANFLNDLMGVARDAFGYDFDPGQTQFFAPNTPNNPTPYWSFRLQSIPTGGDAGPLDRSISFIYDSGEDGTRPPGYYPDEFAQIDGETSYADRFRQWFDSPGRLSDFNQRVLSAIYGLPAGAEIPPVLPMIDEDEFISRLFSQNNDLIPDWLRALGSENAISMGDIRLSSVNLEGVQTLVLDIGSSGFGSAELVYNPFTERFDIPGGQLIGVSGWNPFGISTPLAANLTPMFDVTKSIKSVSGAAADLHPNFSRTVRKMLRALWR